MAEPAPEGPVLAWRGLRLDPGDGAPVAVRDLEVGPGQAVLAFDREPGLLRALARLAAGRDLLGPEAAGAGAARVRDGASLTSKARPGERLDLYRRTALVDSHARLLSGVRLIDTMILEMEYHQGRSASQAMEAAQRLLDRLGVGPLALVPEDRVSGPDRGLALVALAIGRRPTLLVLDRPLGLLDDESFAAAWAAVAERLARGLAALVLDYSPEGYPEGLFHRVLGLRAPGPADPATRGANP
jgi:alpha-D-ribose 1-methylphosphonate 5-triphosphate synthase subunit PhnL